MVGEERSVAEAMTVEELARRAGMTVRNVREHQTRGLLPPPKLVGRKGFYDGRHLARLQLIRELQDEGLNLQAVAWLLAQAPSGTADEVARLRSALFAPWVTDEPRVYDLDELVALFGEDAGDAARTRAESLGLLRPLEGRRWESPAPRLLEAGAQLVGFGVPVGAALDVVERLLAGADTVARTFLDLFVDQLLAAAQLDRSAALRDAVERLRPVASEAVLAAFQLRMDELVARTFGPAGGRADPAAQG
jgi:DNA-binding transcriptional MerR regulator